jgi:sarcosine oxidase
LLGLEGFIAAGPREDTAAAMQQAGATFSWLDRREIAARIPFVAPPWEHGLIDPLGGSLRIRRALAGLARRVDIQRGEVVSVTDDGSVTLADGNVVRGDRVLICAGVQTPALFGPVGVEFAPHTRFTTQAPTPPAPRASPRLRATGCRSGAPGYGRLGRKGRTPRPCARCSHRSRP